MNVVLKPNRPHWFDIRLMVANPTLRGGGRIFFSFSTTWWTCDRTHLYRRPSSPIPCDPRGSVLMEVDPETFLQEAEHYPTRYGKHGLEALAAAFHGNIVVKGGDKAGLPTCLETWEQVNQLIDEEIKCQTSS